MWFWVKCQPMEGGGYTGLLLPETGPPPPSSAFGSVLCGLPSISTWRGLGRKGALWSYLVLQNICKPPTSPFFTDFK